MLCMFYACIRGETTSAVCCTALSIVCITEAASQLWVVMQPSNILSARPTMQAPDTAITPSPCSPDVCISPPSQPPPPLTHTRSDEVLWGNLPMRRSQRVARGLITGAIFVAILVFYLPVTAAIQVRGGGQGGWGGDGRCRHIVQIWVAAL